MKTIEKIETELESLKVGQVMLTYVRPIANDKFSVELAEVIKNPNQNTALSLLNASDDRFDSNFNIRRGYITVSSEKELSLLNVNIKTLSLIDKITTSASIQKVYVIGMMNPTIQDTRLKLRIVEKLQSEMDSKKDAWSLENVKQSAKQDGRGNYLLKNGELIFTSIEITNAEEYVHKRIIHNEKTTTPEKYLVPNFVIEDSTSQVVEHRTLVTTESL